ncbi:hypothetical protein BDV40DRAFT_290180 [Aspergillus tamarii]|uniref:Myb-like domain-containing protein n=1 Tax=Aspergillus tamarii TaxID=41984 RepID=A0A5N6UPL8_ASPTM|nr:hypothetical protein BDV40DRAFT_290180 [Aspergillus tamarii]
MARQSKSPHFKSRRSPIRWTAQEDGILFKTAQACKIRGEGQSLPSEPKKARKDTIAWKLVAQSLPGRMNRDCRKRWFKIDRRWTRLKEAVAIYGPEWNEASFFVKTRNPDRECLPPKSIYRVSAYPNNETKECSEHWEKTLHPFIVNQSWERTDDMKLPDVVTHSGPQSYTQEGLAGRSILEFSNR